MHNGPKFIIAISSHRCRLPNPFSAGSSGASHFAEPFLTPSLSLSVSPSELLSRPPGGSLRRRRPPPLPGKERGRPLGGRRAVAASLSPCGAAGRERDFCSSDLLPSFEDRLSTCDRPAADRPTMGRPPPGSGPRPMGASPGRGRRPISLGRWPFSETAMAPANGKAAASADQPMAAGRDQTRPKIRANQSDGEAALSTGGGRPRPQPTRPPDPSLEDQRQAESKSL